MIREKKELWWCKYKIRVWKEVYSNKTKSTKLSHLYRDYKVESLLKGNTNNELKDPKINSTAINRHIEKYKGKYSAKIEIIGEIEQVSSHGRTTYEMDEEGNQFTNQIKPLWD